MNTRIRAKSLEQQLQQQNTQLRQVQEENKRLLAILFRVREQQSESVKGEKQRGIVPENTEFDKQKIIKLEQRLVTVKSNCMQGMNSLSSEIKTLKTENEKLKKTLQTKTTIAQKVVQRVPVKRVPVPKPLEQNTKTGTVTKSTFRYRGKRARRIAKLQGIII